MSTHTPGPWSRGFGNYVYAGTKEQATTGQAPRIAVCDPLNGTREQLEKAFANADLISAAPDLLDALKFYADPENWKEQESGIGMYPGEADMDCGGRARAAIAKAERQELK